LNNLNRSVTNTGLKFSQEDITKLEDTYVRQVEPAEDKHLQSFKEPGERP